jgi:tRNA A-37 threonylcarbamoyl transferase component Bud32/predicted nucleotidyltransferase
MRGRVKGVMLNERQILSTQESDELLNTAKRLAGNHPIEACCVYGSKIAGYARADSDYDILLVLKHYDHIIKYLYEKNKLDTSVLVVDSRSLVNDAERALLGEFVVGRLLHPYEPLMNASFLEDVERAYRKRVVLEELKELILTDPLYSELIIPVRYFLYSKIHKRGKIYPHALYSYVKTYSYETGKENLERAEKSFMLALQELADEGMIKIQDDFVSVIEGRINIRAGDRAVLRMSNMVRGMYSWLVHTYAGRRVLVFVKQEARSKLKRRSAIKDLPIEFTAPRSLLRLDEGLRLEGRDWLKQLTENLGLRDAAITRRKIGDFNSATALFTIKENDRTERLVVKQFASIKAIKWTAVNIWAAGIKKFDVDPASRLRREYGAMRYLRSAGFNTPEIVACVSDKRLLITRFVEGKRLSETIDQILLNKSTETDIITLWGQTLQLLHSKGHTLVDTKPTNVLVHDNKLFFTDLEQFSFDSDKSWDIACFLYYSLKFTSNEEAARKVVRAFLEGYLEDGNTSVVKRALKKKYISPFYPALVLGIITAVRDEIRAYVTSS